MVETPNRQFAIDMVASGLHSTIRYREPAYGYVTTFHGLFYLYEKKRVNSYKWTVWFLIPRGHDGERTYYTRHKVADQISTLNGCSDVIYAHWFHFTFVPPTE